VAPAAAKRTPRAPRKSDIKQVLGAIETGVVADLKSLALPKDAAADSLAASARHLARTLDRGEAVLATAALARQLQSAMTELREIADRLSEGTDEFADELARARMDAASALGNTA
jgi:hypothetical protein